MTLQQITAQHAAERLCCGKCQAWDYSIARQYSIIEWVEHTRRNKMNTIKMKAVVANMALVATMSLVTLTVPTTAMAAPSQNSDEICLLTGKLAYHISTARENGTSEEKLLAITDNKTTIVLIHYVFTTGFDPQSIRNIVYLKCSAGEYL